MRALGASPGSRRGAAISGAAIRAYDIRGVPGRDFDEDGARELGLSYATAARERGLKRIGVGRDGRLTSPALEGGLAAGLAAGGLEVMRIGLGPTPMLGFAAWRRQWDGAVMVTASHNPPQENGFKLMLGGERICGEALSTLVSRPGRTAGGGRIVRAPARRSYAAALTEAFADQGAPAFAAVWDAGAGAAAPVLRLLLPRLAGRHTLIHGVVDGHFPGHHPDPAVAANLQDLAGEVRRRGCDVGFAFDGDGDRLGVVDEEGDILWADQLLLLLAADLLARRPGAAVVADVKSSRVLFEGVERLGGRAVVAPSGYALVREVMRREGAALAGELSGHVFFEDGWGGIDDALLAAIRTLGALKWRGASLADFRRSLPATHASPELRVACPEARKRAIVCETAARFAGKGGVFDAALGLRVTTADGWWLLRASGTEPKLTGRCEASSRDGLARLERALAEQLSLSGIEPERL